ncbi:hypothetical protein [Paenibacillus sp. MMO-58]|uniref:hypothetical protein n=1 Tax=Paenibacillus sp. MMO-58 TaxID=3081290 RepID=UPI003017B5D0
MDKMKLAVMGIVFLLLLCQSSWLYSDARKRSRSRYPWIWAIWGLIQFPLPLIFYWLIIIRRKKHE